MASYVRSRSRILAFLLGALLLSTLMLAIDEPPAGATPVADSDAEYLACGRVFPDPHAYWPSPSAAPSESPWAKGNAACRANEFVTYEEMIGGNTYLEGLFPDFVEFYNLEEDFGDGTDCQSPDADTNDLCSAGLATMGPTPTRQKSDLYLLRVTDERVPDDNKRFFVFPLSIHGIERAGVEGGTRAAEDLATWAYCEAVQSATLAPNGLTNCTQEGDVPHPVLETQPGDSLTAGHILQNSAIYFMYANPDGWQRGDPENEPRWYQRYNGNSVDMNRDWPTIGFTFRPYTPWSEPETKGFGSVLKGIREQWDGGIDLHGQLIDDAFSFTLLGASQRDYGKDQRILQTVKGAWADAEARLAWSPLIKPNDAPQDDPGLYGVQWGTVWDTIDYTVTGSLGDWIDSPLGLGADGIDNEMSLSHISNCGTGTCFEKDAEQLHVDGNKSLIFAMLNFTLLPEENTFDADGKVGYILDNTRVSDHGDPTPTDPPFGDLPPQESIQDAHLSVDNNWTYEFEVLSPEDGVYNGGLEAITTPANASSFSLSTTPDTTAIVLERRKTDEPGGAPDEGCGAPEDGWEEVNRYFNQNQLYFASGQAVHANQPDPGLWRVCLEGGLVTAALTGAFVDVDINFLEEQAWADPGQLPYNVSNMDFFRELRPYMGQGQLTKIRVEDVLNGTVDLSQFTSLVVADDPFPGYSEGIPSGPAQDDPPQVNNPGAGTAPCAGDQNSPPTCVDDIEFDVLPGFNNQSFTFELTPLDPASDWDLFIQRQSAITGEWFDVGDSATSSGHEKVTIGGPVVGHYRARVVNWAASPAGAEKLTISFSNVYQGPPVPPNTRSQAELDAWTSALSEYTQFGGNLVLTDGAIKNLAYMGLVDRSLINNFTTYAGYIGFTRDGENPTWDDPLAQNVNQPGAAEGPGFRHQTFEPVPIGFAIQDDSGSDFNGSPAWAVDQVTWEDAGGRTVGLTTADQVTLGELEFGLGQVRIIGPLLPMPSEEFYHPFGLSSYALTYTGYQVLSNALQVEEPGSFEDLCGGRSATSPKNHIVGTQGPDVLRGTDGPDVICAFGGADKIYSGNGGDIIVAGAGNDLADGGSGNDAILGNRGNDRLFGQEGNDYLSGGPGTDVHDGGPGSDTCPAGGRRDTYISCGD